MGQDGIPAGPEARAAAGLQAWQPPRLSTNFLQGKQCAGWYISQGRKKWKQYYEDNKQFFGCHQWVYILLK